MALENRRLVLVRTSNQSFVRTLHQHSKHHIHIPKKRGITIHFQPCTSPRHKTHQGKHITYHPHIPPMKTTISGISINPSKQILLVQKQGTRILPGGKVELDQP
jgi:hypothetical protein